MKKIIILLAFLACIFLLEFVSKNIFNASDSPDISFDGNLGIVYIPNQSGRYIKGDEIAAKYYINKQGWNFPFNYQENKGEETFRIAVIGDSFVEAFQVNPEKSFPYLLNEKLKDKKVEVYSFAHSGANLVQYLKILEYIKDKYKPDLFIINTVDNDFIESVNGYGRTDNWSYKFDNNQFIEIPPSKTNNMFVKKILRKSSFIRYMTINKDFVNNSKLFRLLFYYGLRSNKSSDPNINMDLLISTVFEKCINESDSKLLVILNNSQYADETSKILNEKKISYIDTRNVINEDDFFKLDPHWNAQGHEIIANLLFEKISRDYFSN